MQSTLQTTTDESSIGNPAAQPARTSGVVEVGRVITPIRQIGYLSFLQTVPNDDGHLGYVHVAQLHDPSLGQCEAIVKLFPSGDGLSRGLINEITGYLFAHERRIPQPPNAFIVEIPLERLLNPPGWIVAALKKGEETAPAFATVRLDGSNAGMTLPDADTPGIHREIAAWPFCAAAIALDEHLGNGDRHLNNLIRVKRGSFSLIDHGKLCATAGATDWTVDSLLPE